nr:hypothetical protein [Tanacetum cinerariifolium]
MILSGADNRLPLLDKDLYDSWKSIMELYMQNREHGRMILESVENDPLIWPTFEEIGVTRTKKYVKLSVTEKIQADCDMKATNIILQGLPADIYLLVNHHRVAKDLWESLITNARQYTKPKRPSNAAWYKDKAMLAEAYEAGHVLDEEKLAFLADPGVLDGQAVQIIIPNNAAFQTEDLDTYDADCDDILNAKAVLMANIFNYGSDVISKVRHSETYLNDMENQSESKEKEDKYMENEINLVKKIKELDNIIFKVGQSTQTVHMLTKPQISYDNIHKQALGYQNPFYLKKAHRIKPTLYNGIVISAKHFAMPMIDDEETLILEEES